ncbi:MAG: cytidylate kinase-like family protein [Phycisphaerae bacterium]|nr:cytidylate kinase-like family protein [Phycisphaerae bacterium]
MAKLSLPDHMRERRAEAEQEAQGIGPFLTVSRQFGCYGFSLGLLLLEILNEEAPPGKTWKIYNREILGKLATETNLAAELLERERRTRPHLIVDFFRSLSKERIPSGLEIRNRITTIIRGLAAEGYAIIIGQGGAGATQDMPNGLSVRLEGPLDWRVKQVAYREGIHDTQARMRIKAVDKEREYLRKIYEGQFGRKPAFHLTYDCSVFTLAQIAQHIVYAMKLRGCM